MEGKVSLEWTDYTCHDDDEDDDDDDDDNDDDNDDDDNDNDDDNDDEQVVQAESAPSHTISIWCCVGMEE